MIIFQAFVIPNILYSLHTERSRDAARLCAIN